MDWLIFIYRLKSEPSRHRVSVWRQLKKIGALNYLQSVWLLPARSELYDSLKKLRDNIVNEMKGEADVWPMTITDDARNEQIRQAFICQIQEEYVELAEGCEAFFAEIDKEIRRRNFTFCEIEENEEEYNKLQGWLKKISERNYFTPEEHDKALNLLQECEIRLSEFRKIVYQEEINNGGI